MIDSVSLEDPGFNVHENVQNQNPWELPKGPFPMSDCDCDVANNWVLLVSMQPFTSTGVKHQRKISRSQSLSGKGPYETSWNSPSLWISVWSPSGGVNHLKLLNQFPLKRT